MLRLFWANILDQDYKEEKIIEDRVESWAGHVYSRFTNVDNYDIIDWL